jgi:hypothetical protein
MKSDEILIKTFDQVKNDNFDQVKFDQVIVCHIAKVCEWEKNSISFFGCSAEMDIEGVTKILRSLKIFDERKNFSIKK